MTVTELKEIIDIELVTPCNKENGGEIMIKQFCDKCGAEIDIKHIGIFHVRRQTTYRYLGPEHSGLPEYRDHDLCDKCVNELICFLTTKNAHIIITEE